MATAKKRGRPKGSLNKIQSKIPKKTCIHCNRDLPLREFYVASNPLTSSDGKYVNVCKDCVKRASLTLDGELDIEGFRNILQLIDRPFVPEVIDSTINEVKNSINTKKHTNDIIGKYMKNISSLPKYSKLTFMQSIDLLEGRPITQKPSTTSISVTERKIRGKEAEDVFVSEDNEFMVTEEIIDRFGEGYTRSQYRKMQKKYDKLKQNYQLTTNLHEEALATYVRFKVKEEEATACGDVGSADKWNRAAQDAAEKAKLTPKQLTQADLQGGITTISEISKAVEEATDIIEILPRFKYAPNDAPDFIIWCYTNFIRTLKGLPKVEYEEVYGFYDRMKEEYIAQYGDPYGIFENDTSEKNREAVKKFIKLPNDYELGSDNDGE